MTELAINGGLPLVTTDTSFKWPRITHEMEKAIIDQLHTDISIYDKSGIIDEFETEFASYHNRNHALLSNSGTSAIFSMLEAIELMPGDEVICPVYTFHATISPITYTGSIPVFADCDEEGNITLESIKDKLSSKTRAVIVTHMWGTPVKDILKIKEFCEVNNLRLLEDCSHAHGAEIYGSKVGSFGDASAWSLQGQKTITGGEGGIMLTDDSDLYYRALIQGHYNKRPKTEIPEDHPYYKYYLTGMGLKLRSHPLAIAIAAQQFSQIEYFLNQRDAYAKMFTDAFSHYPFLSTPNREEKGRNSWYAYILRFNSNKAFGISREEFVEALRAEGLSEVDIPGSTGLINDLPLFREPQNLMPRLYKEAPTTNHNFPVANDFYNSVIKLPVWTFEDEINIVQNYIDGFKKVCDYLMLNKILRS